MSSKIQLTMSCNGENKDEKCQLFLSYVKTDIAIHDRIENLQTALENHGISFLLTEDGPENERISSRVGSCSYLLCFLSEQYVERVNGRGDDGSEDTCRQEFDYAILKRGIDFIIPIVMEENLLDPSNWKGTLGAALSPLKIVNYSQDNMLISVLRDIRMQLIISSITDTNDLKIRLSDGFYEGALDNNGKPHGQGILKYDNKAIYEGTFKNGQRDGLGRYTFPNGMIYEGDWKQDKKQGNGKLTQKNGDYYEGEFYVNEKNGSGMSVIGKSVHRGQYRNGKMEGHGVLNFENGNQYEGNFFNNAMHEKGVMRYKHFGTYSGDFCLNRRHGKGVIDFDIRTMNDPTKCNQSQDYYSGEWEDDMRKGTGTRLFNNGDRYEGEWENDEMHGRGKTVFHNGATYEGNYIMGQKSGKGKYTYANGNIYEGDFENDTRHGIGVLKYKSGDVKKYVGDFKENKCCGTGMAVFSNGMIYKGEWQQNRIHGKGVLDFHKCNTKSISEIIGTKNIRTGCWRRKISIVEVEHVGNECISSKVVIPDKRPVRQKETTLEMNE